MKIPMYSAHARLDAAAATVRGEAPRCAHVSIGEAIRMIVDGEAVPVFAGPRNAREMVAIQRTLAEMAAPSPSGISAGEMRELAQGSPVARAKVTAWGKLQQANFARLIAAA